MRLLLVVLAHEAADELVRRLDAIVAAASDARAIIHFDARANPAHHDALVRAVAGRPRISLVRRRVRCAWGDYSLVEATFNALSEARAAAEAEGRAYDRVVLLSGACLPCRPIRQLERFLRDNAGREFIEIGDEAWPIGGLRAERWQFWFPLPPLRFRRLEKLLIGIQRLLGIRRRIPGGLTPRLGSQWWALTWDTCTRLLDFAAAHPATMRFFRTVWIPDEMVFQTLVHHLVPAEAVAGFGLTHFQFTASGKPVLYFDDHIDHAPFVPRFFLRKVSAEAQALTERLIARAGEPDDGSPLEGIGAPYLAYTYRTMAQTRFPVAGQLFYRDQRDDRLGEVIRRAEAPYVVVFSPAATGRSLVQRFPEPPFLRLGAVFHPDGIDFGPGRRALGELSVQDRAIRDLHPALYLVRLRRRAVGVPVLLFTPRCDPTLLSAVLDDPNALVIAVLPEAQGADDLRRRLTAAEAGTPPPALAAPRPEVGAAAWLDTLAGSLGIAPPAGLLDTRVPAGGGRLVRLASPAAAAQAGSPQSDALDATLSACAFADRPWFPALASALREARGEARSAA